MIRILYILCLLLVPIIAYTQNDEEFIIGNRIYKANSNWFKISQGMSYHFMLGEKEYNTTLAYSFRIKNKWFRAGYHVSSDKFFIKPSMQRLNDLFFLYGIRKEANKFNISTFAGLTFAYGGTFHHAEWSNGTLTKWYVGFNQIGLFGTVDFTFKPTYDLGIGLSLFGSVNKKYNVVGIQLHIFLSGAYKGKIE